MRGTGIRYRNPNTRSKKFCSLEKSKLFGLRRTPRGESELENTLRVRQRGIELFSIVREIVPRARYFMNKTK